MKKIYRSDGPAILLTLGGVLGLVLICAGAGCIPTGVVDDDVVAFPYTTHAFDHPFHAGVYDCADCHHEATPGSCGATGCHQSQWVGGVPSLRDANHQVCWTCHADETTDAGSLQCGFCHTALLE